MNTDQPPTNTGLYDGAEGKLTMAVFEFIDYMKEYFPLTTRNVDAFEKGSARYFAKIEKNLQLYYESLPDNEKEIHGGVSKLVDRFTAGTRKLIQEARRQKRIYRVG